MSTKIRREKDFINRTVSNYLNATTSKYSKYIDGGPTFVTYYQLDDIASRQDKELETVHSLIGGNTPRKYKQINNTVIYGINALEIVNELSEHGLISTISGEFIVIPDSIIPQQDDFFSFEYEGLEDHLFRVSEVQYDKASPGKYYRCQFEIYPENAELITGNIEDQYEMVYENIGTGNSSIVSSSEAITTEQENALANGIGEKFIDLFYNYETDSFLCSYNGKKVWSPYLQHFIAKNGVLKSSEREFMTEIYIQDVNEMSHPAIFSDETYQHSIFRNIELQDPDIENRCSFMDFGAINLKDTRSLPYFASDLEFISVSPVSDLVADSQIGCIGNYLNSYLWLFEEPTNLYGSVDHFHKAHLFDEAHISRIDDSIAVGEFLYICENNEIEPTEVYRKIKKSLVKRCDNYENVSIKEMINNEKRYDPIFNLIKDYLNGNLNVTEDTLKELNSIKYKRDIKSYILMPIIMFILRNK